MPDLTLDTQVEKRIHQHFAAARTYGKKKEFFALDVKEVDCFYARLARELAGCSPNTYKPRNHKRKAEELLKAVMAEQAAQRAIIERLEMRLQL